MKKKVISILLALSMAGGLLAGCGSTSKKTTETAETETAETETTESVETVETETAATGAN